MYNDTIIALATPPLTSALALIRVSGPKTFEIINHIFSKNILKAPSHTIHYGYLIDGTKIIDEVMINVYRAPKTFTMEDMIEISCHGSLIIVNQILTLLLSKGTRMATKGEFTKRAYLNGRIDLLQAEAVNDIIHGETIQSINIALNSLKGNISEVINNLKNDLEAIIANLEVNIDYPEYYDIEVITKEIILPQVDKILIKCNDILKNNRIGMIIKNGLKTAIIGKPNVGKSSLLNALIEENKAIVTNIAGTTRDIVEGKINLEGIYLNLLDTAGIRHSDDLIENIGIEKAKEVLKQADLVLLILDGSKALEEIDYEILKLSADKNRIIIINKIDLPLQINLEGLKISALNNNMESLKNEIKKVIGFDAKDYVDYPLLTNSRHTSLMNIIIEALKNIKQLINEEAPLDVLSVDLKIAQEAFKELLGTKSSLDNDEIIFSKFCVGK